MPKPAEVTLPSDREVRVKRTFNAPPVSTGMTDGMEHYFDDLLKADMLGGA
jgi:hypothetical protein